MAAATMLGQSKTAFQAEIDATCELIDFWRVNVAFAGELYAEQPLSSQGMWNQTDLRGLEGFVYAVTPFNFTAIGGNLPTAPALMGGTTGLEAGRHRGPLGVVHDAAARWKRDCRRASSTSFPATPSPSPNAVLTHPDLGGIHFTGSTEVFQSMWKTVGNNIAGYKSYPRIVGETGGKDFIVAHASADPAASRGGHRARRLRVSGAEVLRREPHLRPEVALARRARPRRRDDQGDQVSAT